MDVLLIAVGTILLLALAATAVAEHTPLPRVTVLLLLGVICGPPLLNLIPGDLVAQFGVIAEVTLLMVGFLVGGKLSHRSLIRGSRPLVLISLMAALATVAVVTLGLRLLGLDWPEAALLGCIASATAPTALLDVLNQMAGRAGPRREFGDLLLGITALDDVWALCSGPAGTWVGLPWWDWRWGCRRPCSPAASAPVNRCCWRPWGWCCSAVMVMGAMVTNLARHHAVPFHAIEGIELPLMAVVFVLAGASLDLSALGGIGAVGVAYVLLRGAGKLGGAAAGARLAGWGRPCYPRPGWRWAWPWCAWRWAISATPRSGIHPRPERRHSYAAP